MKKLNDSVGNTQQDIFNLACAAAMDIPVMFMDLDNDKEQLCCASADGWAPYNPWGNLEQLAMVVSGLDIPVTTDDVLVPDMQIPLRRIVQDTIHDEIEALQWTACQNKESPDNPTWSSPYNDIVAEDEDNEPFKPLEEGDPTRVYWQAANILTVIEYREFNRFYERDGEYFISEDHSHLHADSEEVEWQSFTDNGFLQSYTIERYLRDPKNGWGLWEDAIEETKIEDSTISFTTEDDNPENFSDGWNAGTMHQHRLRLIHKCLEKMAEQYLTEEVKFNKLCVQIKNHCQPKVFFETFGYKPYEDIGELSLIVEMLINESGYNFEVLYYGKDVSMVVAMRDYILQYSTERYMSFE